MKSQVKYNSVALILLLFLSTLTNLAQVNRFYVADLIGKKWIMQGLIDKTYEEIYDKDKITAYFNGKLLATSDYYLSDVSEEVFDSTRVGKIMEGNFIISRLIFEKKDLKKPLETSSFEIIELSYNRLVIKKTNQQNLLEFKASQ